MIITTLLEHQPSAWQQWLQYSCVVVVCCHHGSFQLLVCHKPHHIPGAQRQEGWNKSTENVNRKATWLIAVGLYYSLFIANSFLIVLFKYLLYIFIHYSILSVQSVPTPCKKQVVPHWSSWQQHNWGHCCTGQEQSSYISSLPHQLEKQSLLCITLHRRLIQSDRADCL